MAEVVRISSNAPWEPVFGYSRAVRAGGWITVSGTTAIDQNGRLVGTNQMYVQARQAIDNIARALERAGAALSQVVRTRVFVTDMGRFEEVARAHREAFGATPPAATAVEVCRLVHPDMLVEIEADAFVGGEAAAPAFAPRAEAAATSKPPAPKRKAVKAKAPAGKKPARAKRGRSR